MMKHIYLDYAAATPLDAAVFAAMRPYFSTKFYNPSATYLAAKAVSHDIEHARSAVAGVLGSRPSEIIFTAGGTEANNLAIQGVMRQFPDANIVASAIEHDSVLEPAGLYERKIAPVNEQGLLRIDELEKLIDDQTVLVSVMYANNEVGTIQPIARLAKVVAAVRQQRKRQGNTRPLYLHTDACQAAAYLDLHVHRLGVDLMTLNGGKIYGPKQSGALFVRTGVVLVPHTLGGGQERGLRSGTEHVAGIIGFATALQSVQANRQQESDRLQAIQREAFAGIRAMLPHARVNGSVKHRLPNNIHITIPGQDNERLVMALDEQGIQCAVGSACSASNEDPSHVLMAMGLREADAQSSLRFSMGKHTTAAQMRHVLSALKKCLRA